MKFLEETKNLNDNFIPGMNMTGRLEPALYVEEPKYKILRNNDEGLQSIGGLFLIFWSKFFVQYGDISIVRRILYFFCFQLYFVLFSTPLKPSLAEELDEQSPF